MRSLKGTYLEGKICVCPQYYAKYGTVCDRQCDGERPGYACPPPPCGGCGKWPPYRVEKCHYCNQIFYAWFGPFLQPYDQFHGQYACFGCLKERFMVPAPRTTWRHPPEIVLPNLEHLRKLVVRL